MLIDLDIGRLNDLSCIDIFASQFLNAIWLNLAHLASRVLVPCFSKIYGHSCQLDVMGGCYAVAKVFVDDVTHTSGRRLFDVCIFYSLLMCNTSLRCLLSDVI